MTRAARIMEGGTARFGSFKKPLGVWGCFSIYRPSSMPSFRPRPL